MSQNLSSAAVVIGALRVKFQNSSNSLSVYLVLLCPKPRIQVFLTAWYIVLFFLAMGIFNCIQIFIWGDMSLDIWLEI